ncbi:MAG: hypothetical protein AAF283_08965, partial [Cyanobacteria bacterium P01_A01_bin.70]
IERLWVRLALPTPAKRWSNADKSGYPQFIHSQVQRLGRPAVRAAHRQHLTSAWQEWGEPAVPKASQLPGCGTAEY